MSTKQFVVRQMRIRVRNLERAVVESLEGRRLLATHIWTGAVSGSWSDPGNWQGGVPQPGESELVLEFPSGAANTTTVNDIANLTVERLRIGQGSYTLKGQGFTLTGGVEAALEAGGHVIENSIHLADTVRIDVSGASSSDRIQLIFAGVISGNGGITKYGHNVRLTADNTYTGPTIVEGGRFSIDGQQPQSDIFFQPSGLFSGTGLVRNVIFGDQYGSMGDAIQPNFGLPFDGLPTITGNLVLNGATYFRPYLGHAGGTLNVVGSVELNNAKLSASYPVAPPVGSTFVLINNDGTDPVIGTFDGIPEGGTTRILDKDVVISYTGGDGNDVVATVLGQEISTRVDLTPSAEVVLPGQGVTLNVSVYTANPSGITPGGQVQLFRDDVAIATATLDASGKASFTINDLPASGSTKFHVTYPGDPSLDLEPARSDDARVRVVQYGQTETDVFVNPTSAYYGQPSVIVARVTGLGIPAGQPTGTVSFYLDDQLLGTVPVDGEGRASMTSSAFPIGYSTVKAVYSGDSNFITSSDEMGRYTRPVAGHYLPTTTTLSVSGPRSNQGQPITLTATVALESGDSNQPFTGNVIFLADGLQIGSAAVTPAGIAVLTVDSLGLGTHSLTAIYSGDSAYYTSDSATVEHTVTPAPQFQSLATSAALVAVGDIDGDGNDDLIWRDEATGGNSVQFLDSNGKVARTVDLLPMNDNRWKLESAGDFNGDGKGELVWRNTETGRVLMWKVFNEKVSGIQLVLGAQVQPGWRIVGTGDFNSDGQADLAWRNDDNGKAVIWAMRGHGVRGVTGLGPVARNLDWSIETVRDVNGDGRPDLVWRNQSTGANAVWLMKGTNFVAFKSLGKLEGSNWTIPGASDFDGDGAEDLLFRNTATGSLLAWAVDPAAL